MYYIVVVIEASFIPQDSEMHSSIHTSHFSVTMCIIVCCTLTWLSPNLITPTLRYMYFCECLLLA